MRDDERRTKRTFPSEATNSMDIGRFVSMYRFMSTILGNANLLQTLMRLPVRQSIENRIRGKTRICGSVRSATNFYHTQTHTNTHTKKDMRTHRGEEHRLTQTSFGGIHFGVADRAAVLVGAGEPFNGHHSTQTILE